MNIHSYFEKLPKDPQEWKNAWPNVLVFDRTLLKNKMVLRESYRKIRPFNDFIWTFSRAHQALHWLGEVIIHTNAKLDKESASVQWKKQVLQKFIVAAQEHEWRRSFWMSIWRHYTRNNWKRRRFCIGRLKIGSARNCWSHWFNKWCWVSY